MKNLTTVQEISITAVYGNGEQRLKIVIKITHKKNIAFTITIKSCAHKSRVLGCIENKLTRLVPKEVVSYLNGDQVCATKGRRYGVKV